MKKSKKEGIVLKGEALICRKNHTTGEIIDSEIIKNLVVNTGKTRIAYRLYSNAYTAFTVIAIGEDATAAAAGNTALGSEVERQTATTAYEADYKATFEYTFSFSSGESYSIVEAGLFDSLTASGSTMLDRLTFTAKDVDVDTDLYIKITMTVA